MDNTRDAIKELVEKIKEVSYEIESGLEDKDLPFSVYKQYEDKFQKLNSLLGDLELETAFL